MKLVLQIAAAILLSTALTGCVPLPQCYGNSPDARSLSGTGQIGSSGCVQPGQAMLGDAARINVPYMPFVGPRGITFPACGPQVLTYADYRRWKEAGIPDNEIGAWTCVSTDPAFASKWRAVVGFSPPRAAAWSSKGVSPSDADKLAANGFKPHNVTQVPDSLTWAQNGFNADDATLLAENHFTPTSAAGWNTHGFSGQEAVEWSNAGATLEQAIQWKEEGLASNSYYLTKQHISAQEAKTWQAAGINISDQNQVSAMNKYLARGYNQKQAIYYTSHGIDPDQVAEYERMKSVWTARVSSMAPGLR
jgi:hypothetical protein